MDLVRPELRYLPGCQDALLRGWSHDPTRGAAAIADELQQIESDPGRFVDSLTDPEAKGAAIRLPDGTPVPRLPGFRLWLWDGEFCGSIGLRWQNGTSELPPWCLGHIGYAVVPWKEDMGYATRALELVLPMARAQGLDHVTLTTDPGNVASQRVILANGGVLQERFRSPEQYGGSEKLRFRISL